MGNCPSCGSSLAGNSRFCSNCGKPANPDATLTVATCSSATHSSNDGRFVPGATLAGRYRIIALLGRGGMGEVYRADDLTLGQQVALKFLPPAVTKNAAAVERFRNEVRIARRVSHPNVCRVYDLGEVEGHVFLSMEYVDGEDLGSLVRRIGKLPTDKALEVARRLCAGLAAAHEKGVLHRDLKPANVMLDGRGQVMLTDFGLAGIADQIEGAEVRNGTPAYMAPEQLAGKEVTAKSDIYSLGLVLYEILTGKRPFEADTLDELQRIRSNTSLRNPSTLVKDLDPRVERVILRCLDPDPQKRPASALSVAAALPGGDPLGEALAAGEIPSPEMVAAAGEGTALNPKIAIALFAAILVSLVAQAILARKLSALERMHLEYSPEVLSQKAREIIQRLGYPNRPADYATRITWDTDYVGFVEARGNADWDRVLNGQPSQFLFEYRQSDYSINASEFHDDQLAPGIVTFGEDSADPPQILSGMISLTLDHQGRLIQFDAVPPQIDKSPPKEFDWAKLFEAAQLDLKNFQPAEPEWTFLATQDARAAWVGKWPGADLPLRIEAAAFRGRPIAFRLIGPWTTPSRMPPRDSPLRDQIPAIILIAMALVLLLASAWFARRNLNAGRTDRRGALRLAQFIFCVHMLLWLTRAHLNISFGAFGLFLVAIVSSVFYAVLVWTLYVALEPYARKHWPQALISWTALLAGRHKDPIVGRDMLFGVALGLLWTILDRMTDIFSQTRGMAPNFGDLTFLSGTRATLGAGVTQISIGIQTALIFFLIIFVLRAILRNQWLAAVAFVLIWTSISYFRARPTTANIQAVESFLLYSMIALMVMRHGLLSLVVAVIMIDLLSGLQVPNPSMWYFADTFGVLLVLFALAIWAFRVSLGGRPLIADDFL